MRMGVGYVSTMPMVSRVICPAKTVGVRRDSV
jgi:hypothetical protein